jgi:two-component system cell cycle response regulator
MMPGADGFEVLGRIKGEPAASGVPILFLSASASEADVVRGVKAGAVDYLHKPFSGPILVTKVQAVVDRGRAERALTDKLRSAEEHAAHDALTGLANRRAFDKRLVETTAHAARHHEPLALLLIDIDAFKAINDTLGHPVGDDALRHLARRLRAIARAGDQAFRYGGEEFVLLLQKCDRAGAVRIFARLRDDLRQNVLEVEEGRAVPFTVSGGVASLEEDNGFRMDDVVRRADGALYAAKRGGRDRVVVED